MSKFFEELKTTLNHEFNVSITEKGATGFRTTGKSLLDLNFSVSSLRKANVDEVFDKFAKAYFEDKLTAIKWLFFAGDVRGGMGERRFFRLAMIYLAQTDTEIARKLLPLVPEFTRWDNLLYLLNTKVGDDVVKIIEKQLAEDEENMLAEKPISLCAKWLPSENATSEETRSIAKFLISKLGITASAYRRRLSKLRRYLKVIEVKMSANEWEQIEYSEVTSKANLIYNEAFLKHDKKRREKYLKALEKGETKINATTLYPHEIVNKYTHGSYHLTENENKTYEALWKALPNYGSEDDSTMVVADGSGSMTVRAGRDSTVTALDIANALAIYFSERAKGDFKDNYITFSENPQMVDFSHCNTLHDKIGVALTHNEVANTNIEKVFDLILTTAIKGKLKQKDMPKNILIISDMEFDYCASSSVGKPNQKLFETLAERFENNGYKLPRLVFWNVCSRTKTIPLIENDLGVALVSGYSPSIAKMVFSNELDPFKALLDQINTERYQVVEDAVKSVIK